MAKKTTTKKEEKSTKNDNGTKKRVKKDAVPATEPQPVGTNTLRMTVGRRGWDMQNDFTPIVLIDKASRDTIGCENRTFVRVKHGQNITLAAVDIQFWELVGTQKASVNEKLGTLIDANEGDVIEIVNDVKPEEKQQFMAQLR